MNTTYVTPHESWHLTGIGFLPIKGMVACETLGSVPSTIKKCCPPFWALSGPSKEPLPLSFPNEDCKTSHLACPQSPTWLVQAGQALLNLGLATKQNKRLPIYGLLAQLHLFIGSYVNCLFIPEHCPGLVLPAGLWPLCCVSQTILF